jgi:aminoglycoside phosphotransferase (APT) family kinase protein
MRADSRRRIEVVDGNNVGAACGLAASLNIEQPPALLAYLRRTGRIGADEHPAVRILAGGVSNRAVLVERPGGESWVLKQALAKLRVAVDWFSDPERIHREAQALRWLPRLAPPGTITPLIFEDDARHILAMRAVPQPHDNWKTSLLAGRLEQDHVVQWGRLLGAIHRNAYERHDEIAPVFADRSFFESLRIEPYYCYAAELVPQAATFLQRLVDETRATRVTLVHGDYSPKNMLVYRSALVLLDHEVIHWGDPAFDLGFSLTHLLSKAHHLRELRGAFADAATLYWQVYRDTVGEVVWMRDLEARSVRHTLACLLARVAGRSVLEYLTPQERVRQQETVLELMAHYPQTIAGLARRWVEGLNRYAHD